MSSICRRCGDEGNEAPFDPAPGLCPVCFEKGMAAIDRELGAEVQRLGGLPPPVEFLTDRLRALGVTESAIAAIAAELA
jgi:hypothetical protein